MANVRSLWVAASATLSILSMGIGIPRASAADLREPPVGGVGRDGDYLRVVHARIHPGWVDGFIRMSPYKQLGPSTSDREAEVSLSIRWDGTIENEEVTKTSGVPDFDAAALNAVRVAAPFPPPVDVLADDGLVHVKWRFARDHRLCSAGQIVHVEYPLRMALPNLTQRGQLSEAVRRMADELTRQGWASGDFVSPFVRDWLSRPNLSNELDTRAAVALAIGGDRQQIHFLETALLLPQTASIVAPALARLGVDVGALLVKAMTGDPAPATRRAVVATVRVMPGTANSCPACIEALASAALDGRQSTASRVEAIQILGRVDRTAVVSQTLGQAAKDSQAAIRGAAILASLPPGRGRVGVIHMAALLHDPVPEIRAAAGAGVLRAGGDAGLEQLFLLGREHDPRPLIAVATELGSMSSEASCTLLAKLLKRSEPGVRVAAIRALVARTDAGARALVEPILSAARLDSAADPAVRELAIPGAAPGELVAMSTDSRLGEAAYRALLRANLRQEAARWLLSNLEQLSAEDRITALGEWIAEPPKYAAQQ